MEGMKKWRIAGDKKGEDGDVKLSGEKRGGTHIQEGGGARDGAGGGQEVL